LRDDQAWLLDILEALSKIEKYAAKGERAFCEEELIQVWIIYYIQIAGEAANQLSDSIKSHHPDIPWKGIIGMRNVLVHQYFGLDLDEIWDTVTDDLPLLNVKIQELLDENEVKY
jgi:uncharacterized protein with HEPN domain